MNNLRVFQARLVSVFVTTDVYGLVTEGLSQPSELTNIREGFVLLGQYVTYKPTEKHYFRKLLRFDSIHIHGASLKFHVAMEISCSKCSLHCTCSPQPSVSLLIETCSWHLTHTHTRKSGVRRVSG